MTTVAFDLNGTLLDTAAIAGPLGGGDDDRALVRRAFDKTVEQALAVTLAGAFPPFPQLLGAALERELVLAGRSTEAVDAAVEQAARMPPHPEATAALDIIAAAGLRLAVVSNSARESALHSLRAADLADRFAVVVGSDEAGGYKPDQRIYRRLLEALDERPDDVWLVTVHWWDVLGARTAGLRTAWVARKEQRLLPTAGEPDVTGADLTAVARAIAG